MTDRERDEFLLTERTCRVASIGETGSPHLSALWFVWDGDAIWLNSLTRSQRWTDLIRDPRVSVLVDAGEDFAELRGVELRGRVEVVGEVPRRGEELDELIGPERLFGQKYAGGAMTYDGRHAWLRLRPDKAVSWDFRKMAS